MELEELRKEPHLSVSSVNDYIDCGLLYKLGRIDKLKPEFRSDALEFGSLMHKIVADFHQERMVGEKPSLEDLQNRFEKRWRSAAEERSDIRYRKGKTFKSILKEGRDLLATYYRGFPDDGYEIMAIEEPFRFTLEGLPVPLIGAMDLVEQDLSGTVIISDFKTAGKAYANDDIDKNFQLTVYHMAARANGYADRQILLRFDCLIKTNIPKFEQYYTTRTQIDEKRAVKKILKTWEGITKGVFIPNDTSWKCRGCAYKQSCDEWFQQ